MALSCGISRVATMQFGPLFVEQIGGDGDLHQDYAHPSSPDQLNDPLHPNAVQMMTNYTARYARYIADLADLLDGIPEGNGTMLDHTIIPWTSELAHGGHGHDGWPAVIIGGGQRFRTGRWLHYEHDTLTTTTASWVNENNTIGLPPRPPPGLDRAGHGRRHRHRRRSERAAQEGERAGDRSARPAAGLV
ncbi:MAG: hypothetical protein HS111_13715 [Kofleriaceae bacterium]|nr:hypothetical protein [Kofleriaceae bacterium]